MRSSCIKNVLVVAVILLFVGVCVQPAFAINPNLSDSEDDCDICLKVSNLNLVRLENLSNKIYKYDNILSVLSKNYPEFTEKYQELSERITTFKEINKELKQVANKDKNTSLCDLLQNISLVLIMPYAFYRGLIIENDQPFLILILFPFIAVTTTVSLIFMAFWKVFCYKGQV